MSSHQDPYHYPDPTALQYESVPEFPVTLRPQSPGESWPQTATTNHQSGYSHPYSSQSSDTVGHSLRVHDEEDTGYFVDDSDYGHSLANTSSQHPGVGTYATHTHDEAPFNPLANSPFNPYIDSSLGFSAGYTYQYSINDSPTQPLPHDAHQHLPQNIYNPQTSEGLLEFPNVFSPSAQPFSLNHGGLVTDTEPTYPTPISSMPEGVNTARTSMNAGGGQHSHPAPVVTSLSNQISAAILSHPPPSSPERRRLRPWSAEDEHSTGRRVAARHDGVWSAHSTSSNSPMRSRRNSEVHRRGPLIPQERYTTSTISAYSIPDLHPPITFNLERPDQTGIPITDILNKTGGFTRLRDRMQAFNMEKKTFTLRVQWPGYGPWSKTLAAQDWTRSRSPITRVKLADAVATAIRGLLEKYRDKPYDPDYAEWNVGPNGIQLDQICLVELLQVSRGSWQPKLCLLEPRR